MEAMTRRRVLCGLLLASAVLAVLYLCLLTRASAGINKRGFDRIGVGMARTEVEAILGGPPSDYGPGNVIFVPMNKPYESLVGDEPIQERWFADDVAIIVTFNEQEQVLGKEMSHEVIRLQRTPPTLTERIRSWLGW
jgi:hypothetical protein